MVKNILLTFSLAGLILPAVFAAEPAATNNNAVGTTAQTQPAVQTNQVHGQVVDERGQPVPGAAWKIAGIEVLRDGKWTRELRMGDPFDTLADAEGRFVISYREPVRFDLQFHKSRFAPAFLYEIGADSTDLKVILKRGERIYGMVTQSVNGKKVAVAGKTVQLRLPSHGIWFQEEVSTDANGKFEFRVCAPSPEPPYPPGNHLGALRSQDPPSERKWQVACGGNVVEVEVKDGQAVEAVNLESEPPLKLPEMISPQEEKL